MPPKRSTRKSAVAAAEAEAAPTLRAAKEEPIATTSARATAIPVVEDDDDDWEDQVMIARVSLSHLHVQLLKVCSEKFENKHFSLLWRRSRSFYSHQGELQWDVVSD